MKIGQKISIVIPTLNEEGNILPLIKRIDAILASQKVVYEIIIVDDNSTDSTKSLVTSVLNKYPIKLFLKKGISGKAQSLLEGFSYAKYALVAMIDADLQYPPESLIEMIEKIDEGNDIVVANRRNFHGNFARKVISKSFSLIFCKLLHGISVDVQSGLKVFKKSVLHKVNLKLTSWTFDLEFLVRAREMKFTIGSVDIDFIKRTSGEPKINLLQASYEIGKHAVKAKFYSPLVVPTKDQGFYYKGAKFVHYTDLQTNETALFRLTKAQKLYISGFILLTIISFILNWHASVVVLIALLTVLYFTDLLFNLFLIYRSFSTEPELEIKPSDVKKVTEWPTYTIFCPLYKEASVLFQFIKAMDNLDYPKDKLQVMLLLEEDDKETIQKIEGFQLPSNYKRVIVPHSNPKTKPKALNYGLKKATGEFIVIYDAEDIPDSDQLKKAITAFQKSGRKTVCIQAKLNFYNPSQNLLTRLFTAEYSLWFDLVLTGLQSISAPIPLGGTSNHFRKRDLLSLSGWDSFNVTEDADLGMRIVKRGFKTAVINSYTYEEANSDLLNWFKQRSRWIKGYMQTYLVHMRRPGDFIYGIRKHQVLTFQLIIGGKILSMIINPFMWVTTISYFVFRPIVGPFIESFFPPVIFYMAAISLVFGNFLYMYYYMLGSAKRKHWDLIKYTILTPLYWLFMSAAAINAFWELIVRPHHWNKTRHGLHLGASEEVQVLPKREIAVVPA